MQLVKVRGPEADDPSVRFDLVHPTPRQLRDGVTCGLIAESIMIPVLLTVTFIDHTSGPVGVHGGRRRLHPGLHRLPGGLSLLTRGEASVTSQANSWFVIACLALAGLACIELSTATPAALYTPAMLVGVIFVAIVGDRRMQMVVDLYALALIALIGWVQGLRGGEFAVSMVIYASTIVVVNFICARTVGSLTGQINFSQALDSLNECFDEVGIERGPAHPGDLRRDLLPGTPLRGDASSPPSGSRCSTGAARSPTTRWWRRGPMPTADYGDLARLEAVPRAIASNTVELGAALLRPAGGVRIRRRAGHGRSSAPSPTCRPTPGPPKRPACWPPPSCGSPAGPTSSTASTPRAAPTRSPGLANRRSLMERIEMEMAHALRAETPLSVAMIDLDHFKEFNDRYGHVVGDTVLRSVAAMMVSNTRDQDMVSRYGGEEFCLVLPDTDLVGGHHILDQLRSGGRDSTTDLGVTLSAGLTSWDGIEDPMSFIDRADRALYQAKNSGRDRVVSIAAYTEY